MPDDKPFARAATESGEPQASPSLHDQALSPWDFVQDIVARYGPRAPGSSAEAAAQRYVEADFRNLFGTAQSGPFEAALDAKFQSLRLFVPLCWIALLLAWWSLPAAAVLAAVNAVLFFGHFVHYRDWLDRLWPFRSSSNVWADLEPTGAVHETLILAGHVDSATEFRWWYRWGHDGLLATIVGGFGLVFAGLSLMLLAFAQPGPAGDALSTATAPTWHVLYGLTVLLAIPAFTLLFIHGKNGVDGAIDNLSGLAIARELGRRFADPALPVEQRLRHTRLRIMSFGSEECGLKGSRAYVRQHRETLAAENARLLNLESFRDARMISVVGREWFTGARYAKNWQRELLAAFAEGGVPAQAQDLMLGATDATSFAAAGLPAICLIGLDAERLDPTYHTRRDRTYNLDPRGMLDVAAVLEVYLRKRDAALSGQAHRAGPASG